MSWEGLYKTWGYLATGGPVMIPLLALCLWMWILIISKLLEFAAVAREERSLRSRKGQTSWQQTMLTTFYSLRTNTSRQDLAFAQALAAKLIRHRNKHIATISILAATAPLLGLLGTVTGMIFTFDGMARFGTGNARVMAGGISQAMITTQAGLVISVPGLFMGNFLRRRAENMASRISAYAVELATAPAHTANKIHHNYSTSTPHGR